MVAAIICTRQKPGHKVVLWDKPRRNRSI